MLPKTTKQATPNDETDKQAHESPKTVIDPLIILLALCAGMLVRKLGYPPMLGYLIAGFALGEMHYVPGEMINTIANGGVTLLLFSIGLKLNPSELAAPQVWAVASAHMLSSLLIVGGACYLLFALSGQLDDLRPGAIWIVAFALSFSSTVFAVKTFEERGENGALHARIAIGILIMQDLAAVTFVAVKTGKSPDLSWLLVATLLLLVMSRPLLLRALRWCGHGELLILCGMAAAFGGAALFESFQIKGDLGALAMGVLLSGSKKSSELATTLLDLKNLLLVGFFITIGLNGQPDARTFAIAATLGLLIFIKPVLYFLLMTALRLRARTALLSSMALFHYSEFGLIVISLAANSGLLQYDWVVIMALALSLSFFIAVPFNERAHWIYRRYSGFLRRFERSPRLPEEEPADLGDANIVVLGMGRVGLGSYQYLTKVYGDTLIGVEENSKRVAYLCEHDYNVVHGDASDRDFWQHVDLNAIRLIMINLSKHSENKAVCKLLQNQRFKGQLAAIARYPDERQELVDLGCISFNLYEEAGFGFAEHVQQRMEVKDAPNINPAPN